MPFIMVVSPPVVVSPTWLWLLSLAMALLSLTGLTSLEPVLSLLTSPEKPWSRGGAFQDGIDHTVPVNDLS